MWCADCVYPTYPERYWQARHVWTTTALIKDGRREHEHSCRRPLGSRWKTKAGFDRNVPTDRAVWVKSRLCCAISLHEDSGCTHTHTGPVSHTQTRTNPVGWKPRWPNYSVCEKHTHTQDSISFWVAAVLVCSVLKGTATSHTHSNIGMHVLSESLLNFTFIRATLCSISP